jgi:hypothetical protein
MREKLLDSLDDRSMEVKSLVGTARTAAVADLQQHDFAGNSSSLQASAVMLQKRKGRPQAARHAGGSDISRRWDAAARRSRPSA